MPIYEYQCVSCGHVFELWQSFTDPAPDKCPECGGTVKKLLQAPQVVFKGTGFYSVDHKKSTNAPKAKHKKEHEHHDKKEDAAPVKTKATPSAKSDEKK